VLDFDAKSGRTATASAQRIVDFVRGERLSVQWILETHAHADHLSGAAWLREQLGGQISVGGRITEVQGVFKRLFHLEPEFTTDGHQFDHLFGDGETFAIGALQAEVIAMPGHTPACVAYRVGDAVFVGDTLFMPDVGTARCDFPGGSAAQLYRSIRRLLSLPPDTRLFMCHDYPPEGRAPVLGNDRGAAAGRQHPRARRDRRAGVRGDAAGARRHAGHAEPDPAFRAGEHPGRRAAAAGSERRFVPEDSVERLVG
jgi:glyoxylase-like metal-dependent hydrolase (beta-lactamase superfamily II)